MRRKLVTLSVVALVTACGFPDVNYESPGGDGGAGDASHTDGPLSAEGSGGDSSADSMSSDGEASTGTDAAGDGGDASTSADTGTDAPLVDADAMTDAPADSSAADTSFDAVEEQPADSGADAPPVCDFDQDTYKAKGATCGGNDCCDTDNKAHPGQTSYFTQADACGSFDYNCNGTNDPEFAANLKCGGTGALGCTGGSAFLGSDPGCGGSALYGTCVGNGLLACQPGNEMTVTQGCH
jgi:hypothetical protein